ncbi:MAG: (2Fe-2S)-binding protein [Gemmatimonadales bacterium]
MRIDLTVNGGSRTLEVAVGATLLDLLRDQLGLTGAKRGCDRGECGACTVLLDGRPALSCLTLAVSIDGSTVTTIEGVGAEEPHPLQTAFVEHDALQCGFCTPGQIMAGIACLESGASDSDERVRAWMSGNLCRCAAYPQIVAAIRSLHR